MRIIKDIFIVLAVVLCFFVVAAAITYPPHKEIPPNLNPRKQYASIDSGTIAENLVLAINMQEALRHEYSDSELSKLPKRYPHRVQYIVWWQNTVDSLMDMYDSAIDADMGITDIVPK